MRRHPLFRSAGRAAFVASFTLICGQTLAADLPRVAPAYKAPVVAPLFNWGGFYSGIHGGYLWSESTGPGASGIEKEGAYGGAQLGWNYHAAGSPVVFGFEADVSYGDIDDSVSRVKSEGGVFGSARLRAGVAADRTLWYVHGGWAWGENTTHSRGSDSQWHHGWTAGVGAEWAFTDAWSAKLEYAYADFGEKTYFNRAKAGSESHTVRVGLNYRWGVGKAPLPY